MEIWIKTRGCVEMKGVYGGSQWFLPVDFNGVGDTQWFAEGGGNLCFSNPGALLFHLHHPQHGIWDLSYSCILKSLYCNTYLWCAHLMVALQLNARLTFTTCCSLESNARVATYHPGGLLSIYSPRLSDRPVSLWDLQFGTCWRWVPFEEKMGITRSKVSDWGH